MKNGDLQTLTDMCKDPQVQDYQQIIYPEEPLDTLFQHAGLSHDPYLFSIVLKDTGIVIGFIERYISYESYKAGVVISEGHRNKGYGTEVLLALLNNMDYQHTKTLETDDKNYLLDDGLIPFSVTTVFAAYNTKAKHLAEKTGFTELNILGTHAASERKLKYLSSR